MYMPCIFTVYNYLYQQMHTHTHTHTHTYIYIYIYILKTLLHVSVLLHHLQGALTSCLLKLYNIKIIKIT